MKRKRKNKVIQKAQRPRDLIVEESIRQFFPPVSHMGSLRPSKWINADETTVLARHNKVMAK
jgi:hypothetical protein